MHVCAYVRSGACACVPLGAKLPDICFLFPALILPLSFRILKCRALRPHSFDIQMYVWGLGYPSAIHPRFCCGPSLIHPRFKCGAFRLSFRYPSKVLLWTFLDPSKIQMWDLSVILPLSFRIVHIFPAVPLCLRLRLSFQDIFGALVHRICVGTSSAFEIQVFTWAWGYPTAILPHKNGFVVGHVETSVPPLVADPDCRNSRLEFRIRGRQHGKNC